MKKRVGRVKKMTEIAPYERIEQRILLIRGQKVMLDADLAVLYGVKTKRLKEQVRRNLERFPPDFMFELTPEEKGRWSQIATTSKGLSSPPIYLTPSQNMARLCWLRC
jgi:hypothetical protein